MSEEIAGQDAERIVLSVCVTGEERMTAECRNREEHARETQQERDGETVS
jgi:hypothetical protein